MRVAERRKIFNDLAYSGEVFESVYRVRVEVEVGE